MKKLLFTYNPNSGKGAVKAALSDIISTFTTGGYDVMVHPTCCAGDAIDFISQRGRDFDLIVSSGGDGMLHELAYGMSAGKVDCPCGYIPSGTVNDFASSLNIPKDMQKCAAMIMQEHFQPVDLGRFNGGYFAYISAFGWFTDVSYVTPQKTKNVLGSFAYFLQGLKSFEPRYLKENSGRVRITWEHGVIEDDFIYCMIGNTHSVGGMKNLVPDGASLTDGMLDCMFVNPHGSESPARSRSAGRLTARTAVSTPPPRLKSFPERLISQSPYNRTAGRLTGCLFYSSITSSASASASVRS